MLILKNLNELKIAAYSLKCTVQEVYNLLQTMEGQGNFNSNTSSSKKLRIKLNKLEKLLEKYRNGFPLDYILREVNLLSLNLKLRVNKNVLIPRPETIEWLEAIDRNWQYEAKDNRQLTQNSNEPRPIGELAIYNQDVGTVIDLGCGCGLIGLFIAKFFSTVVATDVSKLAIKIAIHNAEQNKISNIQFYQSSLLANQNLTEKLIQKPYVLIANLPYVPTIDQKFVNANMVQYEPKKAIFSGKDGLNLFNNLLAEIKFNLKLKPLEIILELDPRNILQAQKSLQEIYPNTAVFTDSLNNLRVLQAWE